MALFDAFLKLDGIKGESVDSRHKGEIDILSFSWGASQAAVQTPGGGGGAGKVHFQDIQFVKKIDAASPLLMLRCVSGEHIKEANFAVRKAGGEQLEYLKVKLTDVLLSSYKEHGNTQKGDETPLEQISLNFSKVEYEYQPQGADGKARGGPIVAGWDVKGNVKA